MSEVIKKLDGVNEQIQKENVKLDPLEEITPVNDLPIISMDFDNEKIVQYHEIPTIIHDDEFFDKICEEARKDIPKEELFNWWLVEALKETIAKAERGELDEEIKKLKETEKLDVIQPDECCGGGCCREH